MRVSGWMLVLGLVGSGAVNACTCSRRSPERALEESAVVFHGHAVRVEHYATLEAKDPRSGAKRTWFPATDDWVVVTFTVQAVWKGSAEREVQVLVLSRPSMCDGFEFSPGRGYLVYLNEARGVPSGVVRWAGPTVRYGVGECPGPIVQGDLAGSVRVLGEPRVRITE